MKIFVFTNVALTKDSSDGRTILNFFRCKYPKATLINFYMNNLFSNNLEKDINYIHISNSDVLKNAKSLHFLKRYHFDDKSSSSQNNANSSIKKNALSMLVRNMIWKSQKWVYRSLLSSLEQYQPDYLFIQMGDFAYYFDLVRKLSKKTKIPIITFNSETYALKRFDYMKQTNSQSLIYRIFRQNLFKAEKKLYQKSKINFVLNDDICSLFVNKFKMNDIETFIPQSELGKIKLVEHNGINIVYAGNISVGREQSLIDLAETLYSCSSLKVTIYGKCDNDVEQKLIDCVAINYRGFVSYNELINKVYPKTDILLHVEPFDSYHKLDLQYAFSTKIVDCLATGIPFFCYAPNEISGIKYVKNKLGDKFISEDINDAKNKIINILRELKKLN